MKIKAITIIILIIISMVTFSQDKEIHISHTYEDLFLTYIAPLSCEDKQEHGPIVIADSLSVKIINDLLEKSERCDLVQMPDVRFKIEFFQDSCKQVLCFGHRSEGMYYRNKLYKYNSALCSYLIDIIEKSGAEKPKRIMPPDN